MLNSSKVSWTVATVLPRGVRSHLDNRQSNLNAFCFEYEAELRATLVFLGPKRLSFDDRTGKHRERFRSCAMGFDCGQPEQRAST